jgi:hypothetical protein
MSCYIQLLPGHTIQIRRYVLVTAASESPLYVWMSGIGTPVPHNPDGLAIGTDALLSSRF